jgi:hypothetical protein
MDPAARKTLFTEVQILKKEMVKALKTGDKATADVKKAERATKVDALRSN